MGPESDKKCIFFKKRRISLSMIPVNQQIGHGQSKQKRIDSVQNTAVARKDIARVLDTGRPFKNRLEQITQLPGGAYNYEKRNNTGPGQG